MALYQQLISSIAVLVGLIGLAMFLRWIGIIKEEDGQIFSKLVTQITLPALIFVSLAKTSIDWSEGFLVLIMLVAEISSLALAWVLGRWMKLSGPQQGAFMLVSGFGSSSLLGYALISQVFPENVQALTEAVVVSEIGVGPALFTIGTMLAMYYGGQKVEGKDRFSAPLKFFHSPIFISVVAGIAWSSLKLPTDMPVIDTIFQGIKVLATANTFAVVLTVGVLLRFSGLKAVLLMTAVAGSLKLILKPVMVWLPTLAMNIPDWQVQVLVLEAAMPSAMLSVVLASSYGCDAKLASKLVFTTTIGSGITVPLMFRLLA
jgi:predicted permease